jgi:hypothetical protein
MMDVAMANTILDLDERVKASTSQFYNHSVAGTIYDSALGHVFGDMTLSVTDMLLVAALSEVHAILSGPSGCGKTALAQLFCQGLFGSDGWYLQKLNPHLTEETFCDIDMKKLRKESIRNAVVRAEFLSKACTVLDECNRTPPALTNVLLGFCDKRIELKCGLKENVGFLCGERDDDRYLLVIASINEGREYAGTFDLDEALSRRFTLRIPFSSMRPTPHDLLEIIEKRTGQAKPVSFPDASEQIARTSGAVVRLPLDPLALIYLVYLGNVGRCPHSNSGFHPRDGSQELCSKTECRIQKSAEGFCPSVSGLCEGVLIDLKRSGCGLAALRAARTVRAISETCEEGDSIRNDQLRDFAGVEESGELLREAATSKYLEGVRVSAEDLKATLPFVGLGGKVGMATEYVAKRFQGSEWLAMKSYVQETYGRLEDFFRQNQAIFAQLDAENGAQQRLMQRLEHAERFSDPAIRWAMTPLLERRRSPDRAPEEVAEEIEDREAVREAAAALTCEGGSLQP